MDMKGKNTVNNGRKEIPTMFLGTAPFHEMGDYKFRRIRTIGAVRNGINLGYGIDCAVAYGNHRQVGRGIRASEKKRSEVFITSKLYNTQQDDDVKGHYDRMCSELGIEKLDLLLQHWPQTSTYINAWKQMEELYFAGKVRYIGMANVEVRHLLEMETACALLPQVIQVERHPLNTQAELISYCKEKGIRVQAYAPIGRMEEALTGQKLLKKLAEKHGKSIPQIILRWHIQTDVIPVVRSVRRRRIMENMDIWDFVLLDVEVDEIRALNRNYKIYNPQRYARYY